MQIENEALFKQYAQEGINLFLGAGFSVEASSKLGKLPIGDTLKEELLTKFGLSKPSRLTLPQLCSRIKSSKEAELRAFLKERFTVTQYDPRYEAIANLNVKAIFTTNIDNLTHNIYVDSQTHFLNDLLLRGPSISEKTAVEYIPLHGCVLYEDGDYDFTPIELASSFSRDPDKWFGFLGRIQKTPTLYWGYRLEDAGVLEALHPDISHGRKAREAWITLRTKDDEAIEYYKSMGFQIIVGDTSELLDFFGTITSNRASTPSSTKDLFPELAIPALGATPSRSISEFYTGAEPSWSDIYSGRLYEIEHSLKAKNTIAQKKNLILLGSTATGKSTLLRQLASNYEFDGIKLFANEISKDKADLLVRRINAQRQPVLLFIDNVADSSESVSVLASCQYLQLVTAERDYYFDTVSHRFQKNRFEIQDITELSNRDIQEIERRIPNEIVKGKFTRDQGDLSVIDQPTLFEVIIGTIRDNSLRDRYVKTLAQLKSEDTPLHDLLAMVCYLYSCRVPTSVDVAAAYLADYSINVTQIHGMFEKLGTMVSNYEGGLSDALQDYFVPRSGPVSNAVMDALKNEDLKRLLLSFHRGVSPTRIPRYDVFKRRAYDEYYTSRAFPNVEEGIEFYENVYRRDPSPYLRQQGALYCLRRGDSATAFNWIDEARAQTHDRNPTIRNTYAVILFKTNVALPIDLTVTKTLRESMEILKSCYSFDKRKVYHAKVFADQAIDYLKKFGNTEEATEYLRLALTWLDTELSNRPDDRRMKSLRRSVAQVLSKRA